MFGVDPSDPEYRRMVDEFLRNLPNLSEEEVAQQTERRRILYELANEIGVPPFDLATRIFNNIVARGVRTLDDPRLPEEWNWEIRNVRQAIVEVRTSQRGEVDRLQERADQLQADRESHEACMRNQEAEWNREIQELRQAEAAAEAEALERDEHQEEGSDIPSDVEELINPNVLVEQFAQFWNQLPVEAQLGSQASSPRSSEGERVAGPDIGPEIGPGLFLCGNNGHRSRRNIIDDVVRGVDMRLDRENYELRRQRIREAQEAEEERQEEAAEEYENENPWADLS